MKLLLIFALGLALDVIILCFLILPVMLVFRLTVRPWATGRQGTGYRKKKIAEGSWWDCWLIRYPVGTGVPVHKDPVPGKQHYRINVLLKGENTYEGEWLIKFWRFTFFRPDIMPHSVPPVTRERLVLSIGWVTNE